jgi:hypothetical protein
MKVGDMVDICYRSYSQYRVIDTQGLVVEIVGYKAQVVVDGELQQWDICDLERMSNWKKTGGPPP